MQSIRGILGKPLKIIYQPQNFECYCKQDSQIVHIKCTSLTHYAIICLKKVECCLLCFDKAIGRF